MCCTLILHFLISDWPEPVMATGLCSECCVKITKQMILHTSSHSWDERCKIQMEIYNVFLHKISSTFYVSCSPVRVWSRRCAHFSISWPWACGGMVKVAFVQVLFVLLKTPHSILLGKLSVFLFSSETVFASKYRSDFCVGVTNCMDELCAKAFCHNN